MKPIKDQEQGDAAEVEEMLPLYSESDPVAVSPELKTPAATATPDQVRDYLRQILHRRGVEADRTEGLIANWVRGSGVELREYPRDMYTSLFGIEDGWILYRDVRLQIDVEREVERKRLAAQKAHEERWVPTTSFLSGLVLTVLAFLMLRLGPQWLQVIGAFFLMFGGLFGFCGLILLIVQLYQWRKAKV